jgi:hypothetical protein
MQTEAQRVVRHLENASSLRKMASELRDSDPEAAERLLEVAEDYERLARKVVAFQPR